MILVNISIRGKNTIPHQNFQAPALKKIVIYLTSSCVIFAFFGMSEPV
jgi:hypothetical protein